MVKISGGKSLSMKRALALLLLAAAWLLLAAGPGRSADEPVAGDVGDERILSFRSEITVLPDSSLAVRETIRVRAARRQINHGIYRDFPTRFAVRRHLVRRPWH
jgi:hypothetical protein